mgnify:CR=1 FL=1
MLTMAGRIPRGTHANASAFVSLSLSYCFETSLTTSSVMTSVKVFTSAVVSLKGCSMAAQAVRFRFKPK